MMEINPLTVRETIMDKSKRKVYNDRKGRKSNENEVILMTPATATKLNDGQTVKTAFMTKRPKSAAQLRKMISVKTTFGKTLVDLYKDGK